MVMRVKVNHSVDNGDGKYKEGKEKEMVAFVLLDPRVVVVFAST
jgi:hypothetical protein